MPISFWLAYLEPPKHHSAYSWRTKDIKFATSLLFSIDHFPPALFDVDQNCIFALTIDPDALQQIRKQRLKTLMVSNRSSYSDIEHIWAELDWADRLYRGNPTWPVIDVTKRAVEETSAIILQTMADRGLSTPQLKLDSCNSGDCFDRRYH